MILLNNIYKTLYKQRPQSASDTHPALAMCIAVYRWSRLHRLRGKTSRLEAGYSRAVRILVLEVWGQQPPRQSMTRKMLGILKVGERPSVWDDGTGPHPPRVLPQANTSYPAVVEHRRSLRLLFNPRKIVYADVLLARSLGSRRLRPRPSRRHHRPDIPRRLYPRFSHPAAWPPAFAAG